MKPKTIAYIGVWAIIALLLLAATTSCSSTRKMRGSVKVDTEKTIQNDIYQNITEKTEKTDSTRKDVSSEKSGFTETREVEYDTSKPIDSTTGRPPIKNERTTLQWTGERSKSTILQGAKEETKKETEITDNSTASEKSTANEKIEASTVNRVSGWWWTLIAGCTLIAIFIAWRIYRTLRR